MQTSNFNLPDFSAYGYCVTEELGHNRLGGRTTYKATNTRTNTPVVIKEFKFGVDSSWTGYRAYDREVQVLRTLDHAGIPHFLDAFETPQGWGLVQEYRQGTSLAACDHQSPEETKHIAEEILKILIYLQSCMPPVIHRDIKLENILLDQAGDVTLVDFGFARIGGKELAASSVVVGTYGMMPPEQLLNRELSCASDLYSLGATLICLLTGIKSGDLASFVDETFAIDTEKLLPAGIEPSFQWWLEKMVAPKIQNRFPNAQAALEALHTKQIERSLDSVPRLKRTREITKTALEVSLAASILISSVGSISFGVYKLAQWGEQQKDAYQVPSNLPVIKPKPHLPKQSSSDDLEYIELLEKIADWIPSTMFCSGLLSVIFRMFKAHVRGEEISPAIAPGAMLILLSFAFEKSKTVVFDSLSLPNQISEHAEHLKPISVGAKH